MESIIADILDIVTKCSLRWLLNTSSLLYTIGTYGNIANVSSLIVKRPCIAICCKYCDTGITRARCTFRHIIVKTVAIPTDNTTTQLAILNMRNEKKINLELD
jgi:hypothetical protein